MIEYKVYKFNLSELEKDNKQLDPNNYYAIIKADEYIKMDGCIHFVENEICIVMIPMVEGFDYVVGKPKYIDVMKNIVYLIQDKDTLVNYGCFDSFEKAQKHAGELDDVHIQDIEVK